MARQFYVVWDEKNGCLLPGMHADLNAANAYIAKRRGKDKSKAEEGKTYDAVQVTIP